MFAGGDKPKVFSKVRTDIYNVPVYANGEQADGLCGWTDKAKVFEQSITISARGTIGYVALRFMPFVPIVRLIVIIPNKEKIIKYMFYALREKQIVGSGANIPQLTVPMVKDIQIPIPPEETQSKIISEFEALEVEISKREARLKELEGAYGKILSEYL